MASTVIQIDNLNRIFAKLRKLGVDAQDLKGATTKASAIVLPQAKANAPVLKGKLQKTVKASKANNRVAISAGTPKSVPYGAAIHWGYPKRNIEPNLWLLKLRDQYGSQVTDTYVSELQKLIDTTMEGK